MHNNTAESQRLFSSCPVCGDTSLVVTSTMLPEGPLLECAVCGQLLSSCSAHQHDSALWKWDDEGGTSPNPRSVARFATVSKRRLTTAIGLVKGSRQPLRLLDVGCSSGSLLRVASSMGLVVAGVEPALAAAQAARNAGFDVFGGYLQDAKYPDSSFDIITLFEIVEHLSDPTSLIKECSRILRPGGVLAINTPNAHSWTARYMRGRWEGFSLMGLGGHASFFSAKSMRMLATRCDMVVCRIETRNVRFYEAGQTNTFFFRFAKILAQLLALPAKIFGQGHDLLVFLRK